MSSSSRFVALLGGETVARAISFATTIYLARTLSPEGYGVFGAMMGVMLYLTQVADGGIELLGVGLVARDHARAGELASRLVTARLVVAGGLIAVTVVAAQALLPPLDGAMLARASLALLATAASTRWLLLGLEQTTPIAIARTLGELVAIGLMLLLVEGQEDALLVPVATVAGAFSTTAFMWYAVRAFGVRVGWRWSPAEVTPLLPRARHLTAFTLLGLVLFNFDLLFLRSMTGAAAAGWYAASYTLIAFAANLIVAFAHSMLPVLTRLHEAPAERSAAYHQACAWAFAAALPAGAGAALLAPGIITLVFGEPYAEGAVALSWLGWTIPLAALRELPVIGLLAEGRESKLLRVNAWSAAANVVLVVACVPTFGLAGAAAATLATEVVRLALAVRHAHEAGFPPLPLRRLLRPVVATGAMTAVLTWLPFPHVLLATAGGVLTYVLVLAAVGGVRWRNGLLALRV
jgi:O-antigen/teichoic acid export membrane protein